MARYKFAQIENPETCPIEELEKEVERLKNLGDFFETKQLALKKFINSVYGATASKYFIAHNTAVAESITLQGQDLNHYSENAVNAYFKNIFTTMDDYEIYPPASRFGYSPNTTYYVKGDNGYEEVQINNADEFEDNKKKLVIKTTFFTLLGITKEQAATVSIAKGKTTETGLLEGSEFSYLDGNQSLTVAGDTDSCVGSTQIYVDNKKMSIADAFTKFKYENDDTVLRLSETQEVIPVFDHTTLSYIDYNVCTSQMPINYIMRHKVFNKSKFRIKTKSGKELIVTGDHSVMVIRDNELVSIPAKNILKTDKIITIAGDK